MAVLESTGSKAATEATASYGTAERCAALVTECVATGGNGVGCDDGTSQCRGNNDDRDSIQRRFPHNDFLRFLYQFG
jgi:hypothetical protein